jgi:hypothetical protein
MPVDALDVSKMTCKSALGLVTRDREDMQMSIITTRDQFGLEWREGQTSDCRCVSLFYDKTFDKCIVHVLNAASVVTTNH